MSTPVPAPGTKADPTTSKPAPAFDVAESLNMLMPGQQKIPPKIPKTPPPPTEGPVIVTPNEPTDTTPPPGDNGAPPPIPAHIPPPEEPISFQNILINILFVVLCVLAVYYGWVFGQQYAHSYLVYWQSWGPWWRGWFTARRAQVSQLMTKKLYADPARPTPRPSIR